MTDSDIARLRAAGFTIPEPEASDASSQEAGCEVATRSSEENRRRFRAAIAERTRFATGPCKNIAKAVRRPGQPFVGINGRIPIQEITRPLRRNITAVQEQGNSVGDRHKRFGEMGDRIGFPG